MARKRSVRSSGPRTKPRAEIRTFDDPYALQKSVYIHDAPPEARSKRYHHKRYTTK